MVSAVITEPSVDCDSRNTSRRGKCLEGGSATTFPHAKSPLYQWNEITPSTSAADIMTLCPPKSKGGPLGCKFRQRETQDANPGLSVIYHYQPSKSESIITRSFARLHRHPEVVDPEEHPEVLQRSS